jgi:hypothetical protein
MTIPEACQLILQASAIGSHEAVYTLDMGEPIAIRVLAEQMIRLAGKQPGRDIAIVYSGCARAKNCTKRSSTPTSAIARPRIRRSSRPRPRAVSPDAVHERSRNCAKPAAVTTWRPCRGCCATAVPEFEPAPAVHAQAATVVAFPARNARRI